MAKSFFFKFGTGDPRTYTGLSPTFILFFDQNGTTLAPPAISEGLTLSGYYKFSYTPTLAIAFLIDGISLDPVGRYISGNLDPIQLVDQNMPSAAGISQLIGAIGSTADSYGSTSADPTSLFGSVKRLQEFNEGNSNYAKASGLWSIYTRGSTALLIQKTLSDTSTTTTKT